MFSFPKCWSATWEELLHERIDVRPFEATRSLPSFIGRTYTLYGARILGRQCVIVGKLGGTGTPADIAKFIDMVRNATHTTVAFATMTISAHNRSRLIGQGVPFIVPGNQLWSMSPSAPFSQAFGPELPLHARAVFPQARHARPSGNAELTPIAAPEVPIAGRGADKYLTDELGENLTIVVDGIDGRTHLLGGIDSARRAT